MSIVASSELEVELAEEAPLLGQTGRNELQSPQTNSQFHIALILLAGAIARIPFYLAFRPIWSGDSGSYSQPYILWTFRIFSKGERTPVYPLFLGLAQWLASVPTATVLHPRAAYTAILMQSGLDVLAAAFFYLTLRSLRIRGNIALCASLLVATIPAICLLEVNILNMSLAFASLTFVIFLFLLTIHRLKAGKGIRVAALSTGAALAIAVLNRPDLLIFAVLLLLITAALPWKPQSPDSPSRFSIHSLGVAAWIAFPVATALLAWMTLMYVGIGEFRITTFSKVNRSRTVYNMFDRVVPEDRVIGEIMSRTYLRQANKRDMVNVREIVWQAEDEIMSNYARYPIIDHNQDPSPFHVQITRAAVNILGLIEVPCEVVRDDYCWQAMREKINTRDYLGTVSWKLARKYPVDWLRNVAINFFEESFTFRYADEKPAIEGFESHSPGSDNFVRNASVEALAISAGNAQAPLLTLMYVVTLGYAVGFPIIVFRKRDDHWVYDALVGILAVASVGTIVGTCVLAGLNRIYTLPHIGVFVICTTYAFENRSRIISALIPVSSARSRQ